MTNILTYADAKHEYHLDGEEVPSVTTILSRFFPVGWAPEFARDLGKDVHRAIELYEADDLAEDSVDEYVAPFVAAYRAFRLSMPEWRTFGVEEMVAHPALRYAGRIDLVFRAADSLAVVDVKSGEPFPSHRLQTAAYRAALREWAPTIMAADIVRRYALYLRKDATFRLVAHHDHEADFRAFAQLRDVYQWLERSTK